MPEVRLAVEGSSQPFPRRIVGDVRGVRAGTLPAACQLFANAALPLVSAPLPCDRRHLAPPHNARDDRGAYFVDLDVRNTPPPRRRQPHTVLEESRDREGNPARVMTMTNTPPNEIRDLIVAHVSAFNTHDEQLCLSVCGNPAIIIDGIATYRWLNPDGPAHWLADVAKWGEKSALWRLPGLLRADHG